MINKYILVILYKYAINIYYLDLDLGAGFRLDLI